MLGRGCAYLSYVTVLSVLRGYHCHSTPINPRKVPHPINPCLCVRLGVLLSQSPTHSLLYRYYIDTPTTHSRYMRIYISNHYTYIVGNTYIPTIYTYNCYK